ncbi:MAG: hypothetical protein NC238_14430 [Dehalobacter sp.]|nr:hypothetical protein [Dehalobacter sp.]
MGNEQLIEFSRIVDLQIELSNTSITYWNKYSSFNDWHFWLLAALLIVPLIILFLFIDRKRMFLLGFFGFSVHIWHSYADTIASMLGMWTYPYRLIPVYPISFALDAALIPVTFMLVYQWTLNHKKNFYLYATITAFIFGFIVKPLLQTTNITMPGPGGGGFKAYLILFISHLLIASVSKWLVDIFRKLQVKEDLFKSKPNLETSTSISWNLFKVRKGLK